MCRVHTKIAQDHLMYPVTWLQSPLIKPYLPYGFHVHAILLARNSVLVFDPWKLQCLLWRGSERSNAISELEHFQ